MMTNKTLQFATSPMPQISVSAIRLAHEPVPEPIKVEYHRDFGKLGRLELLWRRTEWLPKQLGPSMASPMTGRRESNRNTWQMACVGWPGCQDTAPY